MQSGRALASWITVCLALESPNLYYPVGRFPRMALLVFVSSLMAGLSIPFSVNGPPSTQHCLCSDACYLQRPILVPGTCMMLTICVQSLVVKFQVQLMLMRSSLVHIFCLQQQERGKMLMVCALSWSLTLKYEWSLVVLPECVLEIVTKVCLESS